MDTTSLTGGYDREDLKRDFDLVANEENWKMPISATVPLSVDVERLKFAISFFTGSTATISRGTDCYKVEAEGYYLAIGA